MASSAFAHRYGTHPGDTIQLTSPHGPVTFLVAAVTSGTTENSIILSRDQYRTYWNDTMVYLVHASLEKGADRIAVEGEIVRRLGSKYRLQIRSSRQLVEYFASQVHQAFGGLYVLEAITFLLILIALGDTLVSGVIERTRVFGMMRAVGLPRAQLLRTVVLEGAAIGLLGLLLAVAGGMALGLFWVEMQFPAILGWKLDLHFPFAFAFRAAALTMALCLVGSALPSLRAARLSVPDALRNE